MNDLELEQAVLSVSVETGSLVCLGCGHEHDCGIHGCAILRQAVERLTALQAENAELREGNGCLQHNLAAMKATLDQQAKNCEGLLAERDREIERLKETVSALVSDRSRAWAERDAAIAVIPHKCWSCAHGFHTEIGFDCDQTHYRGDNPDCLSWQWRGAQGES